MPLFAESRRVARIFRRDQQRSRLIGGFITGQLQIAAPDFGVPRQRNVVKPSPTVWSLESRMNSKVAAARFTPPYPSFFRIIIGMIHREAAIKLCSSRSSISSRTSVTFSAPEANTHDSGSPAWPSSVVDRSGSSAPSSDNEIGGDSPETTGYSSHNFLGHRGDHREHRN